MNIQYMTQLKENPVLEGFKIEGFLWIKLNRLNKNIIMGKSFQKHLENFYFWLEILIILPLMVLTERDLHKI
ncbi:hypothetical protein ATE47_16115 [Chryseobacterium sp. IHB B 17019]|jgi:hypothetical protein|nr:hypothetical protein ATE47_16115 [Chryseobacterium sp. IHB B 17019]